MKKDPVEIFQTIRAVLQPYATLGFSNRINSDLEYDLWSDKNITTNGQQRTETFFAAVKIINETVVFYWHNIEVGPSKQNEISELGESTLDQIEDQLSITYKTFIEKEWI
jgi:hypothetical protein